MENKQQTGKIVVTLREYLDSRGISRNSVSRKSGVSYAAVNRLYKGENIGRIDFRVLARLCHALGCTVDDLLYRERL